MRRHPDVRLISGSTLYEGRIFGVRRERVQLPSGLEQDLELVVHAGAVAIAALDGEGRMLLVRQYRHATGEWLLEVPAGRLESDEAPLAAARRELEEETGQRASHWSVLSRFWPAPGFCSEHMTLFLARGLAAAGQGRRAPDADEEIEVLWLAPAEVLSRARDAKTLLAAALVARSDS